MFDAVRQDARFAFRSLRRRPGFAVLTVLTLALGVGMTASIFSVAGSFLLRPLPYEADEQVVVFWSPFDWRGVEFDLVRQIDGAIRDVAAFTLTDVTLRGEEAARMAMAGVVSSDFFGTLGTAPRLGRTFVGGEDRPGSSPAVVLSHGLWMRQFGGDEAAIGQTLTVDGVSRRVVGVMPVGYYFPNPDTELWLPLELDPRSGDYSGNGYLALIGRVSGSPSGAAEQAHLDRMTTVLGEQFDYPEAWDKTRNAELVPIREFLLGDTRSSLLLLVAAVGLLLILAVANTAALVLARASDRRAELGMRLAIGAEPPRLIGQLVTESVVLGLLAGVIAVALAAGAYRVLLGLLPIDPSFAAVAHLDWTLIAATLAIAMVAGLLVGLAPVHSLVRGELRQMIPGRGAGGNGANRRGLQSGLVIAQVALAVMLATGAGLLIRSVSNLEALDPGVDPAGVLTLDVFAGSGDFGPAQRRQALEAIVTAAEGLPGVEAAAAVHRLPLRDDGSQGGMRLEDRPGIADADRPNAYVRLVTPGYFRTIGLDLRSGRDFTSADRADGTPVVIVSRALAERFFPDGNAIGRRISTTFDRDFATIVGIVEDVRMTGLRGEIPMVAYRPYPQIDFAPERSSLVLRSPLDPISLTPSVRNAIEGVDPRIATARFSPLADVIRSSVAGAFRLRFLLSLFGLLALALGAVGVYGVLSNFVLRRYREYGIRIALGASARSIVERVVGRGLRLVGIGIVIGLVGTLLLTRSFGSQLYGVTSSDPLTLLGSALALLVVGVAAAWGPAWRAGRAEPIEVLRSE